MQKKKLLIASDCFLPRWDGIARFLSDLLPALSKDFEITVLAPDFPGRKISMPGINIIRLPLHFFKIGDFNPAKAKKDIITKAISGSDIVFTQTIGPIGLRTIHLAKKMDKPVVSYIHSIEWELVTNALSKHNLFRVITSTLVRHTARTAYKKSNLLIVPSDDIGGIMSINGIYTKKAVVHMGVDTSKFAPPKSKAEAKRKLNINPDNIVIGYVGRIAREKGLLTLLDAFQGISNNNTNIRLLIVGDGVKDIKKKFARTERVILAGSQDDVVPYLQAMDIYVLPSLTETSSLSTMEAMSCGLCVISTEVGHVGKYIKNKENGLFFPRHNSTVLALKLKWLLDNPNTIKKLGNSARHTIIDRYEWKNTVVKIKKVLQQY